MQRVIGRGRAAAARRAKTAAAGAIQRAGCRELWPEQPSARAGLRSSHSDAQAERPHVRRNGWPRSAERVLPPSCDCGQTRWRKSTPAVGGTGQDGSGLGLSAASAVLWTQTIFMLSRHHSAPSATPVLPVSPPPSIACGRAVAAIIRLHHSSATAVLVIASPHFSSLPSTHLLHVPHPTFHNERNPSPRPPALDPLPGQAHHSRQYATDEPLQTICKLTPPAVDHTPHAHPASPTHELPSSFATYRKKAQQHGPLNISSGPQVGGHIGGAAGRSLGPIEAGKGMFFDRSELPERFQRLSWSQAEIDAIESGGASLFA